MATGLRGSHQQDWANARLKGDADRALRDKQDAKDAFVAPVGAIVAYAGSAKGRDGNVTIPSKWLLCDGSAVSRTKYSALYKALGQKWGKGDGSRTFNLPDLQDKLLVGKGTIASAIAGTLSNFHDVADTDIKGLVVNFIIYAGVS